MKKRLINKYSHRGEEGAVAVLVALLLVVLLGMTALAVDYGLVYYKDAQLQTAVDAASRVASRILVDDTLTESEKEVQCVERAKYYLKVNGFPEDELQECDIDIDAEKGVSINAQYDVPLNFGRIFGRENIRVKSGATAVTELTVKEGKRVTVDVTFVLDLSGSMYYSSTTKADKKLKPMINSVNKAIDSILKENVNNRVSVVVFSSASYTKSIIELTSSPASFSSVDVYEYVEDRWGGSSGHYEWKTYTYQNAGGAVPTYIGYYLRNQRLIVGGQNEYVDLDSSQGTFTQMGICQGSRSLYNSIDDGIVRVPAVFVMSDGEATYANSGYNSSNIKSSNLGNGSAGSERNPLDAKIGYYTILTANYWKDMLSEEYTTRNEQDTDARFYSLGFDLNDTTFEDYAKGVLNPDTLTSPYTTPGRKLKEYLNKTSNPYRNNYNYSDVYYEATGEEQLEDVLEDFANDVVLPTKTYNTKLTK